MPNFLTKPVAHHHVVQKDIPTNPNIPSVVNMAKSITFFGGTRINGDSIPTLPATIVPSVINDEQPSSTSTSMNVLDVPQFIGENVKLAKSSLFSGVKRVFLNFYSNFICSFNKQFRMYASNLLIMLIHLNIHHLI